MWKDYGVYLKVNGAFYLITWNSTEEEARKSMERLQKRSPDNEYCVSKVYWGGDA